MAKYGARHSRWAPWATGFEDKNPNALPKCGTVVDVGQLNKVNESLNFTEGSLPGDDQIALYEKHFKDGTVDVESVFLPIKDAAAILGAACDEDNGLSHGDDDNAPYGVYGFMTHHVGKGKRYYQVIIYPKVKATTAAESYETRGDNINFATDKITFHVESPACRKYKVVKDFSTESAAQTYFDGIFAGTEKGPGLSEAAGTLTQ